MKKLLAVLLAIAGMSGVALAGVNFPRVPEINPTSAIGALTLLGGSILVLRARLKK